jgi:hypothetical protein
MRVDNRCFAGEGAPPIAIEEDPSVASRTLMCFVTNQSRREVLAANDSLVDRPIEGSCTRSAAIEATSTQQAHGDGSGQPGVAHEECCTGLTIPPMVTYLDNLKEERRGRL